MGCVCCKSKEVTQCWSIPVLSVKKRQVFNICDVCASEQWSKFKHTDAMQSIIINPPKSRKEFEKLATENNSSCFGSSWCEFNL